MKNTIMDLRRLLDGVTWERFPVNDGFSPRDYNTNLTLEGVRFYVKYGLHLQRPALAIIARGHFISFTYVKLDKGRDGHHVILPDAKYEFANQHLFDADFAPYKMALIKLDGEKLWRDEPVIRKLKGAKDDEAA